MVHYFKSGQLIKGLPLKIRILAVFSVFWLLFISSPPPNTSHYCNLVSKKQNENADPWKAIQE